MADMITAQDLHEMKQWELPTVSPKILPILRVTPTKYLLLRDYALRGVWSASGINALLPSSPRAALGTVIHRIIEEAGKGLISSIKDFEVSWERSIREEEAMLINSWIEAHFVPLKESLCRLRIEERSL